MKHKHNLVWIDLEMTGLSPEQDHIIEIATIVTDAQLNVLGEGPVFAIHHPESHLVMDEWNTKQHTHSGLLQRVRDSKTTAQEAEEATITFLSQYIDPGKSPMCGNSVCQDRRFLINHMPKLAAFFHYRSIDVSTLKELTRRWAPDVYNGYQKKSKHLALDDIKDSIDELKLYREKFIKV